MAKPTKEQQDKITRLARALEDAFEEIDGVDYKIEIEAYSGDYDHFYSMQESNNWHRSWC